MRLKTLPGKRVGKRDKVYQCFSVKYHRQTAIKSKSEDLKIFLYHEGRPVNTDWLINALKAVDFLKRWTASGTSL